MLQGCAILPKENSAEVPHADNAVRKRKSDPPSGSIKKTRGNGRSLESNEERNSEDGIDPPRNCGHDTDVPNNNKPNANDTNNNQPPPSCNSPHVSFPFNFVDETVWFDS